MWNLETDFISTYTLSVAQAIDAFLILWGATIGLFLAFGIAEKVRFLINKMVGGKG